MHSKTAVTLSMAVAVLFVAVTLVTAAGQVSEQSPTASIVAVQGAKTTFHSRDMDGRIVEVEVPSNELSEIRTGGMARENIQGMTEPEGRTVPATVLSINTPARSVTVQTQHNQTLVLQMPASTLSDLQIGETLTLVVPR
jgi:hypothetical protein